MAPTVRIQARSFQLSVLSRCTAYILPHTKIYAVYRAVSASCMCEIRFPTVRNLGQVLLAIRYIKMFSVYLSLYQDIKCISGRFCKLHVRNSGSFCKNSDKILPAIRYIKMYSVYLSISRYTLYIVQFLQVACGKFGFLL